MAGVKGRSGGARPGAGRKPKKPVSVVDMAEKSKSMAPEVVPLSAYDDPMVFLRSVWRGELEASPTQVRAATAALPFIHKKLGEGGKKDQKQEQAEKIAGKFSGLRRVK